MAAAHKPFSMRASAIVNEDKLAQFVSGSVEDELTTVPGLGPANKELLKAAGVSTVHQLIGQFLLLRGPGVTCVAHVQAFNDWLAAQGVNAYRSAIVRCIAEKVDTMIPGSFDATAFAE